MSPAPYGLGMSSAESWMRTPREFAELRKVREQWLATWKTETRNAPRIIHTAGRLWTETDFLNPQAAVIEQRKKTKDMFDELQFEMAIAKAEVPAWAKPEYHRHQVKP